MSFPRKYRSVPKGRESEPSMPEPLAYFLTWATYGTWLPGDERGWVKYRRGMQFPDPILKREAAARMTEDACRLDNEQRRLVGATIAQHCSTRGWTLFAVNCRSNHVHVVVASRKDRKTVRSELKAWCTRALKELQMQRKRGVGTETDDTTRLAAQCASGNSDEAEVVIRTKWWAERGSAICVDHDEFLEDVIHYVREGQDLLHEMQR